MPECPRCHQPVDSQAIACPACKTPLKAYGHPGIPIHRTQGEASLCTSCLYHQDDTCNYPQRPFAKECTLYQNVSEPLIPPSVSYRSGGWFVSLWNWCRRNSIWSILLGLVIISLLLSL